MRLIILQILLFISVFSRAQYSLYWHDEFEEAQINPNYWTHEIGGGGWGNNELQYYTNSLSNSFIENGLLKIQAKSEAIFANQYSSARIISKDKFEFRYGRIEARMKIPMGQGIWPAFWMLGANISDISWPKCGEIDVMEHIGNEFKIHGTYHFDSIGHTYHGDSYNLDPSVFHQYAFAWTPTTMTWYVDNTAYFSANITNGIGNKEEFHLPFFILLNVAVGGNWPGPPNLSTAFPAELQIDYIRVYKDASELSLNENQENEISIFPNPATNKLTLKASNINLEREIKITGLNGIEVVSTIDFNDEIDVSQLQPGLYFIEITDKSGKTHSSRFIKQ